MRENSSSADSAYLAGHRSPEAERPHEGYRDWRRRLGRRRRSANDATMACGRVSAKGRFPAPGGHFALRGAPDPRGADSAGRIAIIAWHHMPIRGVPRGGSEDRAVPVKNQQRSGETGAARDSPRPAPTDIGSQPSARNFSARRTKKPTP